MLGAKTQSRRSSENLLGFGIHGSLGWRLPKTPAEMQLHQVRLFAETSLHYTSDSLLDPAGW